MAVTIKDIAKKLGIHHATVSRALNGNAAIKKETRARISALAKEMGYVPNKLAQGFHRGRLKMIAVIVPELKHHFFAGVVAVISEKLESYGYSLMIFQTNDKYEAEKNIVNSLMSYGIAGVMASISFETEDCSHYEELKKANLPLVYFDRVPKDSVFSCVILDNYKGGYNAVKHLYDQGKKNIAYIKYESHHGVYMDRHRGYTDAVRDLGLKYNCVEGGLYIEQGFVAMSELMKQEIPPDAVFGVNDESAIGAMKFLEKNGYRVPQDVAIVGIDNNPMSVACSPELTTLDQKIEVLANTVVENLMEQVLSNEIRKKDVTIDMLLVARGSSVLE